MTIDPNTLAALEQVAASREDLVSDQDERDAVELLRVTKQYINDLEKARKTQVDPLNKQVTAINAQYKPARDRLQVIERRLKMLIARSIERREAANRAAIAAAAEAARAGENAGEYLAQVDDRAIPQGVGVRRRWEFSVNDPSQVPAQFWSIDVAKIQAYLDQFDDFTNPPQIPGVSVSAGSIVAVRGGSRS